MTKSATLRLQDHRAILALVGECRDLGDHHPHWQRHALQNLARLTGAEISVGGEIGGFSAGKPRDIGTPGDWGFENGFDKRGWFLALEMMATNPEYQPALFQYLQREGHIRGSAMRNTDLIPREEWQRSLEYSIYRMIGIDHNIGCFHLIPGTSDEWVGGYLWRAKGCPDFTARHQMIVQESDNTGICLWAVKLSGSAEAVAVDPAPGGVLVTGSYQTGDSTFGAITLPISGEQDAYVVRLNEASGGVEWARSWGGQYGHDTGMDVAFDAAGNAYAAGRINLTAGNANINTDIYVVKYDLAGSPQWAKQFGGTLGDTATALKVGTDGNVLVGGSFRGSMDFDPGAGT